MSPMFRRPCTSHQNCRCGRGWMLLNGRLSTTRYQASSCTHWAKICKPWKPKELENICCLAPQHNLWNARESVHQTYRQIATSSTMDIRQGLGWRRILSPRQSNRSVASTSADAFTKSSAQQCEGKEAARKRFNSSLAWTGMKPQARAYH